MADEVKKYLDYEGLKHLVEQLTNRIEAVGEGEYLPLTGGTLTGDLGVGGALTLTGTGQTSDPASEGGFLMRAQDGTVRWASVTAVTDLIHGIIYYVNPLVDTVRWTGAAGSHGERVYLSDIVATNGELSSFTCGNAGVAWVSDGQYFTCTDNTGSESKSFTLTLTIAFADGTSTEVSLPCVQTVKEAAYNRDFDISASPADLTVTVRRGDGDATRVNTIRVTVQTLSEDESYDDISAGSGNWCIGEYADFGTTAAGRALDWDEWSGSVSQKAKLRIRITGDIDTCRKMTATADITDGYSRSQVFRFEDAEVWEAEGGIWIITEENWYLADQGYMSLCGTLTLTIN